MKVKADFAVRFYISDCDLCGDLSPSTSKSLRPDSDVWMCDKCADREREALGLRPISDFTADMFAALSMPDGFERGEAIVELGDEMRRAGWLVRKWPAARMDGETRVLSGGFFERQIPIEAEGA